MHSLIWLQTSLGTGNYEVSSSNSVNGFTDVVNMNVNLHFLHSHLNEYSTNLGVISEEQSGRLYQNINTMER